MKKLFGILLMTVLLAACGNNSTKNGNAEGGANEAITVKYAKGFTVRDSADVRLVDVGKKDHFALVKDANAAVPEGYTKVTVPIKSTICMTSLQLSNFTILDAHDVVKGIYRRLSAVVMSRSRKQASRWFRILDTKSWTR